VVAHEDVCQNLPPVRTSKPIYGEAEEEPIRIGKKDVSLVVASRDDVMKTGTIIANRGRHASDGTQTFVTGPCLMDFRCIVGTNLSRWQPPDGSRFAVSP